MQKIRNPKSEIQNLFVSGRIEFLGKHTDYCGGRSLVCPVERGFRLSFRENEDQLINLENANSGEKVFFEFSENLSISENHWQKYPQTVARRAARNFKSKKLKGVDIKFQSDLPQAAGLSSSSAFMIAVFRAIAKVNELDNFEEFRANIQNDLELAEYLGCVENGQSFRALSGDKGVGTFGGSQDHAAILCGKQGVLSQFSFAPVVLEKEIVLPQEYCFVIASSGITAEKTGAVMEKYNRVSRLVSEIVNAWKGAEKTLAEIVENVGLDGVKRFIAENDFAFPKAELTNRVEQFYVESFEIIPKVSAFLENGEVERIGELIDISQQNAERFLRNQTPETIYLQRSAREFGAIASSGFGAGFGGSVYALVKKTESEIFAAKWKTDYLKKFPHLVQKAEVFI
ncbi:MAG TPA: galactokinase family protein [Pyrinomonadaceae bacterium]|nr:galactokinase family protein [Pyrinomonadaceae bacterium]